MKKILVLSAAMLLVALPASAKTIAPGAVEFSGLSEFNYSNMTADVKGLGEADTTTTKLTFSGSYYVLQNLGVGVVLSVSDTDTEGDTLTETAIGPQLTYQFEIGEAANLFVAAAIGYNKIEEEFEGESADADGLFWAVGGGLKYFPTDNFSVDASLQYSSHTFEDGDLEVEFSGLAIGAGFSVYLR